MTNFRAPERQALVLPTMASAVFLLSMIQTLVIPALPLIGSQLHAGATTVGWITTSTMLAASALTPLLGRLGDVYGHKPVVVAALLATLAGSVLAATSHSVELLIVARVLQGASFGLFPLAISVLRQELPPAKLTGAMAITSSALAFGSGIALVATGLLTQGGADYRRIFWLTAAMTVAVLVAALAFIPRRAGQGGRVDYVGAGVLGVGLVLLLLPISQGHAWGWTSGRVLGLLAGSVVVLVGFGFLQARTREPLVAMSTLSHRPVLATNLASLFVGYAMFSIFLGATYFVQMPSQLTGFGFDASVLRTSVVYMLPGAVVAMFMGPFAGRLVARFGPRVVLLVAALGGAAGMGSMTLLHHTSAEFLVPMVVGNAVIAVAYAAMPALLVMYVEPAQTGVANSVNSIMRTVGGAIGSALVVTILAGNAHTYTTPAGALSLPTEHAFELAFALGAAAFVVAAALAAFGLRGHHRALTPVEEAETVALGAAGEFATASISLD